MLFNETVRFQDSLYYSINIRDALDRKKFRISGVTFFSGIRYPVGYSVGQLSDISPDIMPDIRKISNILKEIAFSDI